MHLRTRVTALREVAGGVEVAARATGRERFDRVLVAVGRRAAERRVSASSPRASASTERGVIAIDERCRTDDPHIYAVGDVTGEPMLAHRAMRQGKVAAEVIAGRPAAFDNVAVPAVVFTDPEVAWCGLTEREADGANRPVRVARFPWAASGRAATLGRSDGLTKLVVDPESGRVLGVGIVGPGAGELIAEAALAVETAALAEDLAATIHAHPTLSETLMEAAQSAGASAPVGVQARAPSPGGYVRRDVYAPGCGPIAGRGGHPPKSPGAAQARRTPLSRRSTALQQSE